MRVTWRGVELRLLLPILIMVPLGFGITCRPIGRNDPGPVDVRRFIALLSFDPRRSVARR